jgi:NADPH-dependent 2,4-dienoyl-CoA reductase/sulfur reductase-like enzyme
MPDALPPRHEGIHPMNDAFDLVVVGAGPGGMAAAATAAETGLQVCMVDDNPSPGGQIWRNKAGEVTRNRNASDWLRRTQNSRVERRMGWRAVTVSRPGEPTAVRIERDGECVDIKYSSLILATGARELFLPFPGWTLPGVYGAGGLQAFVKSGFDISGKRVVVAGTGPLLLAVAAGLQCAGARIAAVVEQAPLRQLAQFSLGLLFGHIGKLIEGAGYAWSTLGTPYHTGSWVIGASGDERVSKVRISSGSQVTEIEADMLAVGFHLIPNTELAQLLHCECKGGYVVVDSLQQTSVKGIYCVGEATGIGGVEKALIEGRIAALAASGESNRAKSLFKLRDRQMRFVEGLASTFRLRDELRTLATDETVVCRCEDVPHGQLAACHSWREGKLHTRCGMGACQGKVCGPATQFLYGWEAPTPRPPIFPVDVGTLAVTSGTERA